MRTVVRVVVGRATRSAGHLDGADGGALGGIALRLGLGGGGGCRVSLGRLKQLLDFHVERSHGGVCVVDVNRRDVTARAGCRVLVLRRCNLRFLTGQRVQFERTCEEKRQSCCC